MTRYEIIQGLKFTIDMFLFNPSTGEKYTEPRNDMDKTTIDACRGAIELLEEPRKDEVILTKKEYGELVSSEYDNGYAQGYREALEQQEPFDHIRAEIDRIYERKGNSSDCLNTLDELKRFIDKYKAESEVKE